MHYKVTREKLFLRMFEEMTNTIPKTLIQLSVYGS
jgi:hypothetical protein